MCARRRRLAGAFGVEEASGRVFVAVAGALDYEQVRACSLGLSASDAGEPVRTSATALLHIALLGMPYA